MPIYEYVCMACEAHFEEPRPQRERPRLPGLRRLQRAATALRVRGSRHRRATELRRDGSWGRLLRRKLWNLRAEHRHRALDAYAAEAAGRTRCRPGGDPHAGRGVGDPDADLMFVGEARASTRTGRLPFVGQAGKLLDRLLGGVGLTARTCTSRTSGNAGRLETATRPPDEIESCELHLFLGRSS